jgi:hypothetical protein
MIFSIFSILDNCDVCKMLQDSWVPMAHLMPVILATQEAEIGRIVVQSQPWQIVCETLSQYPSSKRATGVAQVEGPEFKPQY